MTQKLREAYGLCCVGNLYFFPYKRNIINHYTGLSTKNEKDSLEYVYWLILYINYSKSLEISTLQKTIY